MSVMHCGDVGCPCRNLPPAVDDAAALRAEVVRLRAVVGRVRAVRDAAAEVLAALDGGAAT